MIKTVIALVLSLLVLALLLPSAYCCCQEVTEQLSTKEHGCCSRTYSTSEKLFQDSGQACWKHVCSCKSKEQTFVNSSESSSRAFTESTELNASCFDLLLTGTPKQNISIVNWQNRAPPKSVGMGSSLTYLFKRTFLI